MPPIELLPNAKVYRIPKSVLAFAVISLLFFGICFLSLLALPIVWPGKSTLRAMIPGVLVMGGLSALSVCLLRVCRKQVVVTEDAIWYGPPGNLSVQLLWEEINKRKEYPFTQRLVIADLNAHRKIALEYQLENFDELLAVVLERTRNRQDSLPTRTLFRASRVISVFFVGSVLFCTWLAYLSFAQHAQGPAWFFVGFGVLLAWGLLAGTRDIQIRPNEIILESWLRRRSVPFSAICDVKLRTIVAGKGGRALVVGIERRHKKPIMLGAVREGPIALYESLLHHWRSASGSYLP